MASLKENEKQKKMGEVDLVIVQKISQKTFKLLFVRGSTKQEARINTRLCALFMFLVVRCPRDYVEKW